MAFVVAEVVRTALRWGLVVRSHLLSSPRAFRGFVPAGVATILAAMTSPRKLPELVTDKCDPILKLLAEVAADGQGQVAAADKLERLLREKNLLYEATLAPRFVGFDPCNRDGQGGNPLNVLALISEIAMVGWSEPEVQKATCAETVPGDDGVERFNVKLSTGSGMAPVDQGSIRYGTLACGHTNFGLRCIAAGVPSSCPYLSEEGRMSLGKLERRDPAFASAVASGLRWKVVKWEVRYLYPQVLHFLQAARNAVSTMYRTENEMQGLLRIHAYAGAAQKMQIDIPWPTIKATILRSKPAWADSFDAMIAFVASRSGGVDGRFLLYLAAFHRNHVDSTRNSVPGSLYRALADFPFHYVALAIFQAAWRCPPDFVTAGRCTWISASEVNGLAKSADVLVKAKLQEADRFLALCRTGLPEGGVSDEWDTTKLCKAFARLDICMARFVLEKQETSKAKFATPHAVCNQFLQDLRKEYPAAKLAELTVQFAETTAASKPESADPKEQKKAAEQAAAKVSLYSVATDGTFLDPVALLRQKGFNIGCYAQALARPGQGRPPVYKIVRVADSAAGSTCRSGGAVVLQDAAAPDITRNLSVKQFLAEYEVANAQALVEKHPGWPEKRASNTAAVQAVQRRACVMMALSHLSAQPEHDIADVLEIYAKPRKVEVTHAFSVGALVLFPETHSVKTLAADDVLPQEAWQEVTFLPADEQHRHFLVPSTANDCVAPFWMVGFVETAAEANMELQHVVVQTIGGHDYLPHGIVKVPSGRPDSGGEAPAKRRRTSGKTDPAATAADSAATSADEPTIWRVKLPIYVNAKPLRVGEPLTVYRKPIKKDRAVQPINVGALAKKAMSA